MSQQRPDDRPNRLSTGLVAQWRSRLGSQIGARAPDPPFQRRGVDGMADYNPLVELSADEPDEFGAMMYARTLSKVTTYCALHTPLRLERTSELVRDRPYENLVVLVSSLRGHTTVRQGTRDFAYLPGQLVFVNFAVPYSHYCDSVTDPMGLIIPIDLLGRQRHTAERARRPVASHTLLSRAAAGFVTRFAVDTAISAAPAPPLDTELAAVDLITAALAELNFDSYRLEDNALFVHEAAMDLIERHHRDPEFSPDVIAEELHLSRRQVYRNFEKAGESVAGLIAARRVETAREMLALDPDLSIGEVAVAAGFPTVATFRNRFRSHYGVGPREFRKLVEEGGVDPDGPLGAGDR